MRQWRPELLQQFFLPLMGRFGGPLLTWFRSSLVSLTGLIDVGCVLRRTIVGETKRLQGPCLDLSHFAPLRLSTSVGVLDCRIFGRHSGVSTSVFLSLHSVTVTVTCGTIVELHRLCWSSPLCAFSQAIGRRPCRIFHFCISHLNKCRRNEPCNFENVGASVQVQLFSNYFDLR